jgi:ABC-type bacteriocin/lantibiotic exporter with double-glycine peptidase domain
MSLAGLVAANLASRPGRVTVLLLSTLVLAAFAVLPPIIVARIVDQAVEGRATVHDATIAMIAIAVLALCDAALTLFRRRLTIATEIAVRGEEATSHFTTMTRLPMTAYGAGNEAALIRSFDELDTVIEFTTGQAVDLIAQTLIVLSYVVLMLVVDWRMAAVFVGLSLLGLAHSVWHAKQMQTAADRWLPLRDRRFGFIVECITSMLTIKSLSAHAHLRAPFGREQGAEQAALREFRNRRSDGDAVSRFWTVATPGIGTAFGVVLLTGNQLTAGSLVLFLSVSAALVGTLSQIHQHLQALHEARASLHRMHHRTQDQPEALLEAARSRPDMPTVVAGEGITFRHAAARSDVLCEVSLRLEPGRHVAMVGVSGVGKTTLAYLLARLLEPAAGRVSVDGQTCDLDEHRRAVVVVPHTVAIFSTTLRENVRLWDESFDDAAVSEALRLAGLARLAQEDAAGLERLLGAHGNPLSAGQRQRIGLARAFLRKPSALILDEATSALDAQTEHEVLGNLRQQMKHGTLLVITHREAVAASFDRVIRIRDGRIVEQKSELGGARTERS